MGHGNCNAGRGNAAISVVSCPSPPALGRSVACTDTGSYNLLTTAFELNWQQLLAQQRETTSTKSSHRNYLQGGGIWYMKKYGNFSSQGKYCKASSSTQLRGAPTILSPCPGF